MRTKQKKQILKDFKIQGFNFNLQYLKQNFCKYQYHRNSVEIDNFAMRLLILKPKKPPSKLYNFLFLLFSICSSLTFPHCILSYLVFPAIKIPASQFSPRDKWKGLFSKSSFASSWDELFTSQSAFVFKHINPLGLPGLFCLILSADSSFLQMLLFCVNRGKYNLLPSSELPHAQLHALTAGHGK